MRIIKLLLCAVMVLFLLGCVPKGGEGMLGSGTTGDPYQVATASDLDDVRNDLSAYYIQTANIDLSGYANWVPIGEVYSTPFIGSYYSNGFTISNLTINQPGSQDLGLFCHIETSLPISGINIINADITGDRYLGVLAGNACCNLIDCSATGALHYSSLEASYYGYNFGGLVGIFYTWGEVDESFVVTGCSADVIIDGGENPEYFAGLSGGLIGLLIVNEGCPLTISKCFAIGDLACPDFSPDIDYHYAWKCGGLIGIIDWGSPTIENCYARGDVICPDIGGGLIGWSEETPTLINCYSTGLVQIPPGYIDGYHLYVYPENSGGLCGFSDSYDITSCYYDTETSGQSDNDGRGLPKSTVDMKIQGTFIGWDFSTIWILDSGNDGYPHFIGAVINQCKATQLINSARTGKIITPVRF